MTKIQMRKHSVIVQDITLKASISIGFTCKTIISFIKQNVVDDRARILITITRNINYTKSILVI